MRPFVFISYITILDCVSCKGQGNNISESYLSENNNYSIQISINNDSLTGIHCFVTPNGDRIDCCLEKEGNSLNLKREGENEFQGILKSCYDDESYKTSMVFKDDAMTFFINPTHPFLPDSIYFKRKVK